MIECKFNYSKFNSILLNTFFTILNDFFSDKIWNISHKTQVEH